MYGNINKLFINKINISVLIVFTVYPLLVNIYMYVFKGYTHIPCTT